MKMSTSRNFNKSGVQPYRNLDDNVAKNVELSKIHLGKSSEPHKSSFDSQIDISTLDSKDTGNITPRISNTHPSLETHLVEQYQTLSLTAQFSLDNEVSKKSKFVEKYGDNNLELLTNSREETSNKLDATKSRTSNDTCINITPTNASILREQAQDIDYRSETFINNDKNYTSQISAMGISEETPILLANRTDTQNLAENSINQDSSSSFNETPNVANQTTYEDSDESNFEAFDDECPLLINSNDDLGTSSSKIQNSALNVPMDSELNEFDNRRFFRYPQGTSLRVAPSNNDLNDPDISSKIEEGLGIAGDFQDDSSSYYDKSDKDSPLHGYDFKNMKDLNLREYPAGQSLRQIKRKKSNAYPIELKKTGVALIFMVLNFCATTISLALTHERTPDKDPLPDFLLDNVQNRVWGLTASEIVLQINVISAMIVLIMHKHRFIILRRLALILGLLYGYRAITMFVTNLPKADPNYFCAEKAKDGITLYEVLSRAFSILSGFGLSMNGKHYYCGDYIYSGHTMTIILAHLLIQEYTSKRLWLLHWLTFILAILGIAFLVVGRGHYTIDIIIAYWLTTRLWWVYHSMASFDALQSTSANTNGTVMNHFVKIWWWPLFRWFECNVRSGPLPNGFNLPLPTFCLKVCVRIKKSKDRSTPIFPGAASTDSAINAASFLVNNLSNLTGNISSSTKSSHSPGRTSRSSSSKSGSKGRTSKHSSSNSVGNLMTRTLLSHKQAE